MKTSKEISILTFFLLLFASLGLFADSIVNNQIIKVYRFNIDEMIAPPVWRTTKIAIENAKEHDADLIIIHMNTYGGMLDAADSIRTKILDSQIPVYVFIDKKCSISRSSYFYCLRQYLYGSRSKYRSSYRC